ncbi:hypothetical protein TWF694_011542 [Orbilia ellipsospora]|uniref:Uncharacterized protein n=1 Tax=Orbilia ellipsospora TaxID=2528407 RepID=A0AAV9X5H6_9PEZI
MRSRIANAGLLLSLAASTMAEPYPSAIGSNSGAAANIEARSGGERLSFLGAMNRLQKRESLFELFRRNLGEINGAMADLYPRQLDTTPTDPVTGNTGTSNFDLAAWDAEVIDACDDKMALLSNLVNAKTDPAGVGVCYNIPFYNATTGAFASDIRLWKISNGTTDWETAEAAAKISLSVQYQGATVKLATANANGTASAAPVTAAAVKNKALAPGAVSANAVTSNAFGGGTKMIVTSQGNEAAPPAENQGNSNGIISSAKFELLSNNGASSGSSSSSSSSSTTSASKTKSTTAASKSTKSASKAAKSKTSSSSKAASKTPAAKANVKAASKPSSSKSASKPASKTSSAKGAAKTSSKPKRIAKRMEMLQDPESPSTGPQIKLLQTMRFVGQVNPEIMKNATIVKNPSIMKLVLTPSLLMMGTDHAGNPMNASVSAAQIEYVTGAFSNITIPTPPVTPFVLPGTFIAITPIGLYLYSAYFILFVLIVGWGTVERYLFRMSFRKRSAELAGHTGAGKI